MRKPSLSSRRVCRTGSSRLEIFLGFSSTVLPFDHTGSSQALGSEIRYSFGSLLPEVAAVFCLIIDRKN
jgi:hypothetical protein